MKVLERANSVVWGFITECFGGSCFVAACDDV